MRHAKSSWGSDAVDDHDRPLNARGRGDAPRIGRWLAHEGLLPETAYVSSAKRAQETFERLGQMIEKRTVRDLYMASPGMLLNTIVNATEQNILIVAHNPGIGTIAQRIVTEAPDHPRFQDYPTAATLVVEFDAEDWQGVGMHLGRLRAFVTPHDLKED